MSQFLINKEELWENFMINTNSIFKMLSQPKFWLCLPPGLGVVTRPWMTEVWSRDCISYQSSDDVGIMSRVFYWVLFWDCCWWCCNQPVTGARGWPAQWGPLCSILLTPLLSCLGMLLITGHTHLATSWHMSAVSTQWETRPVHYGIFGATRRTFNNGSEISSR